MWKLNPLLPYAAMVLTLAIAPNAQAARLIPVPTLTSVQLTNSNNVSTPPFILDGEGEGNAAIEGINISVETSPTEATVYKFCFDYGTFDLVYDSLRTNICNGFINNPVFNDAQLPNLDFATRVAGDPNPPLPDDPTSDGLRTALNMGDNIIRALGNYDEFPTFSPIGFDEVFIPYLNVSNELRGVALRYENGNWSQPQTGQTIDNGDLMFVRFQQTGTVDLDPPEPPDPSVPEPSGIFGIFLAGISLCLTVRRS